jgi:hypothetical protein
VQIAAAAFSPDNKYLATSFTAGRMLVTLWEVASTEKNALGVVSDNDYRLTVDLAPWSETETTPGPLFCLMRSPWPADE